MTLILALGNDDYVVQVSDRRLSSNGHLVDDESNKCGVLFCLNARMSFGYTGLAKWNDFSTQKWLLKSINESGPPDYLIGDILERLKNTATNTFKNSIALKGIPAVHKRLSVMFSGYINLDGYFKPACAILSNYHNFENNSSFPEALDEFSVNYTSAKEGVSNPIFVQRIGNWHAVKDEDIISLKQLIKKPVPDTAIVGKSFEIVRTIADRPKSMNTIGKQLTSISIPKDLNSAVRSNYSSDTIKQESYMPAMVYLLPDQHMTIDNISIKPVESTTPPLSVPKVHKNAPCPCGSKKKYKRCHGRSDS